MLPPICWSCLRTARRLGDWSSTRRWHAEFLQLSPMSSAADRTSSRPERPAQRFRSATRRHSPPPSGTSCRSTPSRRGATLPPRWRCTRPRGQLEPSSMRRLLLPPTVSYNDRVSRRTRDSTRHLTTMNYRQMPLAVRTAPVSVLDLNSLKRAFFYIAVALMFIAPFSQDPMALAVGAAVPWVILQIIARPGMPASVVYLFIWQWLQTFTRVLQSMVDNESMANGLYGPNVARAYWYMLAGLVVMALALRMVLGNLKPPTVQDRRAHFEWRPLDLFSLYVGMLVVAVGCRFATAFVPALDQPLDAVSRLKVVLLFMLFTTVMTTGRSTNLLWGAVVLETVLGFTGLLSDFRGVFVYLAMAALASRVPLKGTTVAAGLACAGFLIFLALFWTSVKAEYREYATGSSDSQNVKVALDARFGYLGNRLISPDA